MWYWIWTVCWTLATVPLVVTLYPFESDDFFPLYTDLATALLFLPAYFVLLFGVIGSLIHRHVKGPVTACFFFAAFLYSLALLPYPLPYRVMASTVTGSLGFLHFVLSVTIYKHTKGR